MSENDPYPIPEKYKNILPKRRIPPATPLESTISYCLPALETLQRVQKRARFLLKLENQITCLADQLQRGASISKERGRGITREMRELSQRIMNLQADYKGMTGRFYHPDEA